MTRRCALFVVLLSVIGVANTFAQSSMGTVDRHRDRFVGRRHPGRHRHADQPRYRRSPRRASAATAGTSPSSTFALAPTSSRSNSPGFSTAKVPTFAVGVNETVARNVALQVGAATETVTVTAQSELLQTSSVGLGHVVDQKVIRELPLQGGNFTPLLLLSPGVNPISTAQGPGANGGSELALGTEGNSGMPGSMFVNASIRASRTARRSITWTASSTRACAPARMWRCPISIRSRSSRSNRRATRRSTAASPAAW